jgi:hypothetical protein
MGSMLSLLDVLPRHERVDIGGGQKVDVCGISGEDIGKILHRYPNAFQQLIESGSKPAGIDPGLLGALLAAAQRNGEDESLLGNEKVERMSRSLGIGAQMKMLQALGRCTFPDGVGPFLEGLVSMSSAATEAMQVVVQVASKGQATASRPTRKPSAQPATLASGS